MLSPTLLHTPKRLSLICMPDIYDNAGLQTNHRYHVSYRAVILPWSITSNSTYTNGKILVFGAKAAFDIQVRGQVSSNERDRKRRYFPQVSILFKENLVSMISSQFGIGIGPPLLHLSPSAQPAFDENGAFRAKSSWQAVLDLKTSCRACLIG